MARGDSGGAAARRIVERRLREWEIQRDQRPRQPVEGPTAVWPYVALSREVGSGAGTLAKRLSERLGWPVYDKQILEQMSADDDVRRRMHTLLDERDENWFDAILRPLTLGAQALRNDYFRCLRMAVGTISTQESAIFLGRGAGLLLPPERGVSVRLIAPHAVRVAVYAKRRGIDSKTARDEMGRVEEERSRFLESHFGPAWNSPERSDLIVNTGRLKPEVVMNVIVAALKGKVDVPGIA